MREMLVGREDRIMRSCVCGCVVIRTPVLTPAWITGPSWRNNAGTEWLELCHIAEKMQIYQLHRFSVAPMMDWNENSIFSIR